MNVYDTIIVGSGLAGLHCAMRLSEKYPHSKIALTESQKYIGGRAYTYVPPQNKKLHWEAGAGRINEKHSLMNYYVEKYGLTKIPIKNQSSFLKLGDTPHDNTWPSMSDLFIKTLKSIPKHILLENTLYDILKMIYDTKTVENILYSFPYRAEVMTLRADLALESFSTDMSKDASFYVIKEGFSALIKSIRKDLEKRGVRLLLEHKCISITSESIYFQTNHSPKTLQTKNIILAIPAHSLANISQFNSNSTIKHLSSSPLLRIYAVFPKEQVWFQDLPNIVTNTPIRHIIPVNSKNGVIMASYTDGKDTEYWQKIHEDGDTAVSEELVKGLRKLFPDRMIPDPLYLKYHYWKHGATYWLPGMYNVKDESEGIMRPFPKTMPNIYVCGESYSLRQAWAEGALEHAEQMLVKYF